MFLSAIICEVVQLTNETFGNFSKPTMVKFYAPWCGHCKALAPKYEELATKSKITIAELDCTAFSDVCNEQNVEGFPTIKLYLGSETFDYQGHREVEPMQTWIEKMQLPMLEKRTLDELKKEAEETGHFGYILVKTKDPKKFEDLLSHKKGMIVIGYQESDKEELVGFREGRESHFYNLTDLEGLDKFSALTDLPLCPQLDGSNFQTMLFSGFPLVIYSTEVEKEDQKQSIEEFKKFTSSIDNFVFGYLDNKQFDKFVDMLQGNSTPEIFIFEGQKSQNVYGRLIEGTLTETISKMLKDFSENTMTPIEMKKEEQEEQDQEPNKLVKLINYAVFGGLALAAIFAIWFACKCMRSGKKEQEAEEIKEGEEKVEEAKEGEVKEGEEKEEKEEKPEEQIVDDKKMD